MARYIPLILFTVLTNAAAQIMLKKGMLTLGAFEFTPGAIAAALPRVAFNPFVMLGFGMFVVSMASHLLVLSRVDLSFAYPFLSIAYVVVAVYSYVAFSEDLNSWRIAGIALICLGTVVLARG